VAVTLALFFGHGAFWVLFGMEILQSTHTFSKIAVTLAGFHLVTTATRDFGIAIAQLDHAIQDYKYLEQFHTTQPFIRTSWSSFMLILLRSAAPRFLGSSVIVFSRPRPPMRTVLLLVCSY